MKLQPIYDNVLVQPDKVGEEKVGNLYIPPSAQKKPITGNVTAIGQGRLQKDGSFLPMQVSVGSKVIYSEYSGTAVKLENVDYIILKESDIFGIVEN